MALFGVRRAGYVDPMSPHVINVADREHATPRSRTRDVHLAASSTAAVLGVSLWVVSGDLSLKVIGASLAIQGAWWFAAAALRLLRPGRHSPARTALVAAPLAVAGTIAFDVGWVDRNIALVRAGAVLLVCCVALYAVIRTARRRPT
jgi:hypothetical protein